MGNLGLLAELLGVSRGAVSPTTTLNMAVPPATSAYASLLGSLLATPATPSGMVSDEYAKELGKKQAEMDMLNQIQEMATLPTTRGLDTPAEREFLRRLLTGRRSY